MLGGDEAQRSRIVSWREGLGLVGVLLASVLPLAIGLPWTVAVFSALLALAWWAWTRARAPQPRTDRHPASLWLPFSRPAFRRRPPPPPRRAGGRGRCRPRRGPHHGPWA